MKKDMCVLHSPIHKHKPQLCHSMSNINKTFLVDDEYDDDEDEDGAANAVVDFPIDVVTFDFNVDDDCDINEADRVCHAISKRSNF